MPNVVVHDRRLEGIPPRGAVQVDESTSLHGLLIRLSSMGGINRLAFMCHGEGGGMKLCRENLTLFNVDQTHVLRGKVNKIIIYACAVAETRTGNRGTARDGWRFCQSFATYANTPVIASTVIQEYHPFRGTWDYISTGGEGIINYGNWEGPLWEFQPGGAARRLN